MTDAGKKEIDNIITKFQSTKVERAKDNYEKVKQNLIELSNLIQSLDQKS